MDIFHVSFLWSWILTNGKLPAVWLNIISIWLNEAWKTSHKNKQHNIIQMNIKRIFSSTLMVFDHVSEWTIFSKNVQWKTQFYPWIDSITWESTFSTTTRLQVGGVGGTFLTNGFNFINLKTYKSRYPVCAFHVISVISNSINFNACSDYQHSTPVTKSKTRIVEKKNFFSIETNAIKSLIQREETHWKKLFLLSSIICYFYFKIKRDTLTTRYARHMNGHSHLKFFIAYGLCFSYVVSSHPTFNYGFHPVQLGYIGFFGCLHVMRRQESLGLSVWPRTERYQDSQQITAWPPLFWSVKKEQHTFSFTLVYCTHISYDIPV